MRRQRKSWGFPKIEQQKLGTTFFPLPSPPGQPWGFPCCQARLLAPASAQPPLLAGRVCPSRGPSWWLLIACDAVYTAGTQGWNRLTSLLGLLPSQALWDDGNRGLTPPSLPVAASAGTGGGTGLAAWVRGQHSTQRYQQDWRAESPGRRSSSGQQVATVH